MELTHISPNLIPLFSFIRQGGIAGIRCGSPRNDAALGGWIGKPNNQKAMECIKNISFYNN